MSYEQLIKSVDECADDKIRQITESAVREAEEIKKDAAMKDERIKKRHMVAAKNAVETERGKSIAQIRKETRMDLIRAKDMVYQKVFQEAMRLCSSARDKPQYAASFKKMLQEVVAELEGEIIELRIDRRDENLCKKVLPDLNCICTINTDITTAGGLNASTKDGRFVVFNTLESRLERAKVLLKPEIFAELYGGQGGV